MLQESHQTASDDMKLRALREELVEAERILIAIDSAMAADAHLLSESESSTIAHLMTTVRNLMQSNDHEALHRAVENLAKGTEEFAARRMDQSVRSALAGKKLDELG
jgi:molecular chaperone HscA